MSLPHINDVILESNAVVADENSSVLEMLAIKNVALQISWTSTTASASFIVQVSNDKETWINEGASQAVTNDSGDVMILIADAYYKYMRVQLDWASGSVTTAKVTAHAKGI